MDIRFGAGVVIYARDLGQLARFYAELVALPVVQSEPDFVVLESPACQVVLVAMPDDIAHRTVITSPPLRRENVAIKPCFAVSDLAAARRSAIALGGGLGEPASEWMFRGHRVCDGFDTEGNIFQLRCPADRVSTA